MLPPPQRHDDALQRVHDEDSWPGVAVGTARPIEDVSTEPGFERIHPKPGPAPLFPPPPVKDAPRVAGPAVPPGTAAARPRPAARPCPAAATGTYARGPRRRRAPPRLHRPPRRCPTSPA